MDATDTAETPGSRRFQARADLLRRPWFAYLSLAALQLLAVWGIWDKHDLTTGDTAAYFRLARGWYEHFTDHFAWHPLYTAFYGSVLFITPDAYAATILHRLIIVFAATMMVLAVARRLLPATIAWVVAAWWAVLPINFNSCYEVHLFAVVPVLACWWLLAVRDNTWTRGAALAILVAAAALVRNELGVAVVLFAGVCLWREWQLVRAIAAGARAAWAARVVSAYVLPMTAVTFLTLFFYHQSVCRFDTPGPGSLREAFRWKHEENMAQVFAFGYQQRHPEWRHSPWTENAELMERHFGKAELPLSAMVRANPRAVLEHMAWNFSLVPNGLQVLLFDATSGGTNPDYWTVGLRSKRALACTVATLLLWATGLALLFRARGAGLRAWCHGHETVWLAMLCVAAVAVPVIATQRPRPSYLFPLGVFLMTFTGLCLAVTVQRFVVLRRCTGLLPLLVFAAYLFAPIKPQLNWRPDGVKPCLDTVRRLEPYKSSIARDGTRFLKGDWGIEVWGYVGYGKGESIGYELLSEQPAGVPLDAFLEQRGINLVYLDQRRLDQLDADRSDSAAAAMLPNWTNWNLLGCGNVPGDCWRLYELKRNELKRTAQ
jgi:hypothetical protein